MAIDVEQRVDGMVVVRTSGRHVLSSRTPRIDRPTAEDLRGAGLLLIDRLQPPVRDAVVDGLDRRMAAYPLPDDDVQAVVSAPLGFDRMVLAHVTDPTFGADRRITVLNEDLLGTEEGLAYATAHHDLDVELGQKMRIPLLPWLVDHELRHPVVEALLSQVEAGSGALAHRTSMALGIPGFVPGVHTAASAIAIIRQLGAYAAGGLVLPGLDGAVQQHHLARELLTEALVAHDHCAAAGWPEPALAWAVGPIARGAFGGGDAATAAGREQLRELGERFRPFLRSHGPTGVAHLARRQMVDLGVRQHHDIDVQSRIRDGEVRLPKGNLATPRWDHDGALLGPEDVDPVRLARLRAAAERASAARHRRPRAGRVGKVDDGRCGRRRPFGGLGR